MMIEKIQWRSMNVSAQPISINEHQHDVYDDEKRLDIIDLSGLSLDTISLPAIHLAAICKLDLSNNNLLKIPETIIARLVNVVALDVHSNQLTTLPDSIGCLSKLKLLNVSSNLLHSLPQTIKKCRMLEELSANFNKLSALPETIGFELLNLKKLSVNSNRIMFLPYSTPHLTALRLLDVRLNCLRLLPEDLEGMVNLEVLNVSQNFHYLSKLPDSVGLLVSLVELDVSYNNITTLPSSIGSLKRLRKLDVEANPLVSPPMHITEMGLHTLKIYLTGAQLHINSPTQKKTWFGQLKKHKTRNTTNDAAAAAAAASTGRYKAMLSPHRLFS